MGILESIKRLEGLAPPDPQLIRDFWSDRIAARNQIVVDAEISAQYMASLTRDAGWEPDPSLPVPSAQEYREATSRLRGDTDAPPLPRGLVTDHLVRKMAEAAPRMIEEACR